MVTVEVDSYTLKAVIRIQNKDRRYCKLEDKLGKYFLFHGPTSLKHSTYKPICPLVEWGK